VSPAVSSATASAAMTPRHCGETRARDPPGSAGLVLLVGPRVRCSERLPRCLAKSTRARSLRPGSPARRSPLPTPCRPARRPRGLALARARSPARPPERHRRRPRFAPQPRRVEPALAVSARQGRLRRRLPSRAPEPQVVGVHHVVGPTRKELLRLGTIWRDQVLRRHSPCQPVRRWTVALRHRNSGWG
jgi:hypothetical protein